MRKFILLLILPTILFIATACAHEIPSALAIPPQIEEVEEIEEAEPSIEEAQVEEVLPEPPVITEMPYISDFGRQVTEDFLVQFLTLFSFGWRRVEGEEYFDLRRGVIQEAPLVWTASGPPYFFDNRGNIIEDAPFLLGDSMIAASFELFDLNHSGIPDILVRFGIPETGAATRILYRFVDGEFVASTPLDFFILFCNEQERIIALFHSEYGQNMLGYYYMIFEDSEMILEPIVIDYDHSTWWDFHSNWQRRADGTHFLDIDTIFGTDIPITHVPRLIELEAEITTSIKERLGLTQ